jgi:hypothetical protein
MRQGLFSVRAAPKGSKLGGLAQEAETREVESKLELTGAICHLGRDWKRP